MKKQKATINWFRRIAIAEGISFLVLVLIAMPLKYLAGLPEAVKIIGWAHGILFVAFLFIALAIKNILNKNFGWMIKAFVASILPMGTFVLDWQMARQGDFKSKKVLS